MREKEKMKKGLLYDAGDDKELVQDRMNCKDLCFAYNHIMPSNQKGLDEVLEKLLKKKGEHAKIMQPFWCDYGYHITLGNNVFINHNCTILDGAEVSIGDNVFIAPDCGIHTAGHPLDVAQRIAGLEYAYPITIHDNVWIGANVTILPGVTIGKNSVIGAGAVVNKDIPEGVIAAGNPCRVIRKIEEDTANVL